MYCRCGVILLLVVMASVGVFAQEATVSMDFQGVELKFFLEWFATISNRRIIYSAVRGASIKKKIFLISPEPVPERSVEKICMSLLESNGLTLVRVGEGTSEVFKLVETSRVSTKPIAIYSQEELDRIETGDYYVSQLILIKYLKAANVLASLRQAKLLDSQVGSLVEIKGANALVVSDFLPNIRRIVKIVRMLDIPPGKVKMSFISLRNSKAADISRKLQQLFQQRARELSNYNTQGSAPVIIPDTRTNSLVLRGSDEDLAEIKELISRFDQKVDQQELFVTLNHSKAQEVSQKLLQLYKDSAQGIPPVIIADARTNSLLLRGRAEEIENLKRYITRFDMEVKESEVVARIYTLKHATPDKILPTLKEFINTPLFKEKNVQPGRAPQNNSQISVLSNAYAKTLLITAPLSAHRHLDRVINQLDIRRPQVLLEAVICEFTPTDTLDLGIELAELEDVNEDNGYFPHAITSFGLSTLVDQAGAPINPGSPTSAPAGRIPAAAPGLTGFITKDSATNIPILIRALQSVTRTEVLSAPRILTDDGERAEIRVEQEEPVTSTNALNTSTSTTSFKEFVSAGTVLIIKPEIVHNDWLRLEVEQNIDTFLGRPTTAGIPPPKASRSLKTVVTVPNGHTIILGGLVNRRELESVDKIPVLGDIPLLGILFQSRSHSISKTNIYIFITPRILNHPDFKDIKSISEEEKQKVKRLNGVSVESPEQPPQKSEEDK